MSESPSIPDVIAEWHQKNRQARWLPITSAPRSGSGRSAVGIGARDSGPDILLWNGRNCAIGFWNGRSWDDGDFHDDMGEMTHWMPLPDGPVTARPGNREDGFPYS